MHIAHETLHNEHERRKPPRLSIPSILNYARSSLHGHPRATTNHQAAATASSSGLSSRIAQQTFPLESTLDLLSANREKLALPSNTSFLSGQNTLIEPYPTDILYDTHDSRLSRHQLRNYRPQAHASAADTTPTHRPLSLNPSSRFHQSPSPPAPPRQSFVLSPDRLSAHSLRQMSDPAHSRETSDQGHASTSYPASPGHHHQQGNQGNQPPRMRAPYAQHPGPSPHHMQYYPYGSDGMYGSLPPATYPSPMPPTPAYSMAPHPHATYAASSPPLYAFSPAYAPWGYYPMQSHGHPTSQPIYTPSPLNEDSPGHSKGLQPTRPAQSPQPPYPPHNPPYSPHHHQTFVPTSAPGFTYTTSYAPSNPVFTPQFSGSNPYQQPFVSGTPNPSTSNSYDPLNNEAPTGAEDPRGLFRQQRQHSSSGTTSVTGNNRTPPGGWWYPMQGTNYQNQPFVFTNSQPDQIQQPSSSRSNTAQSPSSAMSPPLSSPVTRSPEYSRKPSSQSVPTHDQLVSPSTIDSRQFGSGPTSAAARAGSPLPQRSEWVMWVGNVPSDATKEELLEFFSQGDSTGNSARGNLSDGMQSPGAASPLGSQIIAQSLSRGPSSSSGSTTRAQPSSDIASVFLIARSNCAFVNFNTEPALEDAIQRFNGRPLRKDGRCPKLVCRVRRKDDDLKAGVGGQRNMGYHARWVKDQKRRQQSNQQNLDQEKSEPVASIDDPPTSPSTHIGQDSGASMYELSPPPPGPSSSSTSKVDYSGQDGGPSSSGSSRPPALQKNSSGTASTTSSLLSRHFPARYFILKSLTQYDLDLSVQRGLWSTQIHNEPTLDQAYRTSQTVYLIFGVNKSGEFFGYATMESRIPPETQETVASVEWEARPSKGSTSPVATRTPYTIPEEDPQQLETPTEGPSTVFLTPDENHPVQASPDPIGSANPIDMLDTAVSQPNPPGYQFPDVIKRSAAHTAPAEMTQKHRHLSLQAKPEYKLPSLPKGTMRDNIQEDPSPNHDTPSITIAEHVEPEQSEKPHDSSEAEKVSDPNASAPSLVTDAQTGDPLNKPLGWGTPFKIKWVKTDPLPFHRTRHLRNPWNNDREIKVSRDGTEIEPSIGQQLIDEWNKPPADVGPSPLPTIPPPRSAAGRGRVLRGGPGVSYARAPKHTR